jgi:hypothetical protein
MGKALLNSKAQSIERQSSSYPSEPIDKAISCLKKEHYFALQAFD